MLIYMYRYLFWLRNYPKLILHINFSSKTNKQGDDSSSLSSYANPYNWADEETKSRGGHSKFEDHTDSLELAYMRAEEPDRLSSYISSIRNAMVTPDQATLDIGILIFVT